MMDEMAHNLYRIVIMFFKVKISLAQIRYFVAL